MVLFSLQMNIRYYALVLCIIADYTWFCRIVAPFVYSVCLLCPRRMILLDSLLMERRVSLPEREKPRVHSEQVMEVLQTCYDPCCKERSVSVVELGLIQGVKIAENGHDVRVELLLTSGWCPFSTHLLQMIDQNVRAIEGVDEVDTEIVWNTVWTPERMSESARQKLTLPMAHLLPLRQRRLEREAKEAQAAQSPSIS